MTEFEAFKVISPDSFLNDIITAPRSVSKALKKTALPRLRSNPVKSDPPTLKRLDGLKGFWRYKLGTHRLVYRVDVRSKEVTLLFLGDRKDVYDRLEYDPQSGPSVRIVATAPDLLEVAPTKAEAREAWASHLQGECDVPGSSGDPDVPLPMAITEVLLQQAGVSEAYWPSFFPIVTEGDLLDLSGTVPNQEIEAVLNGIWPTLIDEVLNQPMRVVEDDDGLDDLIDGNRSLESFLLKLDEEQQPFVDRFSQADPLPTGPWIVKGGPGTGKSTLALYCADALARAQAAEDLFGRQLHILFTTHSKPLIRLSEHLLSSIGSGYENQRVTVSNVDQMAFKWIPHPWKDRDALYNRDVRKEVEGILRNQLSADPTLSFWNADGEFVAEEIEAVILGNGLHDVQGYLDVSRAGRGRQLGKLQRQQIWSIWRVLERSMEEQGQTTFTQRLMVAEKAARPTYDYVFIDEAQDLKPVAIRFCIKLCKHPENVFLTADANQSIYGNGISWSAVAGELKLRGRSKVLRRNYRTTFEISEALSVLSHGLLGADQETLDETAVFKGERPIIGYYHDPDSEAHQLNKFLRQALIEERLGPGCAAIVCPTNNDLTEIVGLVDPGLNAKAMNSTDVDVNHEGVKVITYHAAKGLEFPVVAVARAESGKIPWPLRLDADAGPLWNDADADAHEAQQRRLFFVACTRAMKRLQVLVHEHRPSPFVQGFTDEYWEIWT